MLKLLSKILGGSKSEKDVKSLQPVVQEINNLCEKMDSLTDEQLKMKTAEFRERIARNTAETEAEIAELTEKVKTEALDAAETQDVRDRLKILNSELFDSVQATLDEILPEAFAVVKQVCKRLTERQHSYTYADNHAVWNMIPYDVQLIGGMVIHQGKIAEMQTGEGKTLVSVFPLYLNALAGKGVHLVTVNDYLARRDCEWMKPVFDFLDISSGSLQQNMDSTSRQRIYGLDITYGTNNEFGFDYLRDNMVIEVEHMVQREHWFAIVDEVDSVLIDEARTPLIISGPVGRSIQKFEALNPRVKRLVEAQNKLINEIVKDAAEKLASQDKEAKEEAGIGLLRAQRGLPKHKRFLKMMQEPDAQRLKHQTEMNFLKEQGKRMHEIDEVLYYTVDEKSHQIDLQQKGIDLLATAEEDPDMFMLPDIATEMSQIEGDQSLAPSEKQRKVDNINRLYSDRSERIHTVHQLLRAHSLYERDIEYVVQEDKVMIVDEHTGRIMEGRRYSDGLHQAIEAKENVKVEKDTQTFATITLQNYYRLYNKLAGMTGTAETEAAEFEKIYELEVVAIPTNRAIVRDDMNDQIYKTKREKFNAVIDEIVRLREAGRACLVGTASVEVSEVLSKMLKLKGIQHNVLNAKNHQREAEIVSLAGRKAAVTIATNMAGRGTDIKLDPEVKQAGGLAIIGSERHESRRIDRQLRGRAGRQGDPGSSRFYISLEDNLIRLFGAGGDRIASAMERLKLPEGEPIEAGLVTKSVERAQKKVEENNFGIRKRLLEYDDVMNQQREVIYTRRRHALNGERLKGELFEYIEDLAHNWYEEYHSDQPDLKGLKNEIRTTLLVNPDWNDDDFASMTMEEFTDRLIALCDDFYKRKEDLVGGEFMKQLEKVAVLQTIDEKWRDHLRSMDEMKEGIYLRAYGQKDPLLEYKQEAYKLFIQLVQEINKDSVHFAFKYFPQVIEAEPESGRDLGQAEAPQMRNTNVTRNLKFERTDTTAEYAQGGPPRMEAPQGRDASTVKQTFVRDGAKFGRNDMVTVRYADGSVKKEKYKKVENDINIGKAILLD